MVRRLLVVLSLVLSALAYAAPHAPIAVADDGCAPAPADGVAIDVVVGEVACQELTTTLLGPGIATPFMYYVPPQCDPATGRRCPVLYLLHGFGGDYTDQVGTLGHPSAWVESLTKGPPPGFENDPRGNSDPAGWVARDPIGLILIAPRGRTLEGGYGPGPDLDSYWGDWNPR